MTITIPAKLINQLQQVKRVAMLTGAGVSKESGVPTFRDALEGLWADFDPQELATPQAFRRNPKLVWDWYAWRREEVQQVEPNPGHFAIAQLEKIWDDFTLITQNVDSLHQRAGSTDVVELHGNIARVKCMDNDHIVDSWEETEDVPACIQCGSLLRPDVVWFGEMLPAANIHRAVQKSEQCEVFINSQNVAMTTSLLSALRRKF